MDPGQDLCERWQKTYVANGGPGVSVPWADVGCMAKAAWADAASEIELLRAQLAAEREKNTVLTQQVVGLTQAGNEMEVAEGIGATERAAVDALIARLELDDVDWSVPIEAVRKARGPHVAQTPPCSHPRGPVQRFTESGCVHWCSACGALRVANHDGWILHDRSVQSTP